MTASILGLKRSHARCNIALSMLPQQRSLMTSHWDAETCLWPFQLRSIHSSPRDLNLGCWVIRMGAEASNSACPGRASESICRIFNVYDLYRRSSSTIRHIVGSLTPTFDTNFRKDCPGFAKDCPKSALESFQRLRGSSRYVLLSESLPGWNLR